MENLIKDYSDNSLKGINALVTDPIKALIRNNKNFYHGSNIIACCRKKN